MLRAQGQRLTEVPMKAKRELSVFDTHALAIARSTMPMVCIASTILGGPNHAEAIETIARITGRRPALPEGCTCQVRRA